MGGCVATSASGQPLELYFLSRTVRTPSVTNLKSLHIAKNTDARAMKASAHRGVFIAENVIKAGRRSSYAEWGIIDEQEPITTNSLFLSLCAKNGRVDGSHQTNVNWTAERMVPAIAGEQPSLYQSGNQLSSPLFMLTLAQGVLRVTDSFSGTETMTEIQMNDNVAFSSRHCKVFIWCSEAAASWDFIVSAYANDWLDVNQLTLPMKTLPTGFAEAECAVFEFQSKTLIEI